jgi:predicted XRE-type DNA-binding protein
MDDRDASTLRANAEFVMKIGMLLETGRLDSTEAAEKLGLTREELDEMLRGESSDWTVAKISEHLNQPRDERR